MGRACGVTTIGPYVYQQPKQLPLSLLKWNKEENKPETQHRFSPGTSRQRRERTKGTLPAEERKGSLGRNGLAGILKLPGHQKLHMGGWGMGFWASTLRDCLDGNGPRNWHFKQYWAAPKHTF